MLTKYYLHIDGEAIELNDDCLKNWADIKCSYKRDSYGGVVRSFSSEFEFCGLAFAKLMELYFRKGFLSEAEISVHTSDNNWQYSERFRCPLDFTTIEFDDETVTLNSVDNSLAAYISANKSTTYELEVGKDVATDGVFYFDRIPMTENVLYEFTQGTSYEDYSDITVYFRDNRRVWVGSIHSEVSVGGSILWKDDQEDEVDSYCLQAYKNTLVKLSYDIAWNISKENSNGDVNVYVRILRNGVVITPDNGLIARIRPRDYYNVGYYDTIRDLLAKYPEPQQTWWANVAGLCYIPQSNGQGGYMWVNSMQTPTAYFNEKSQGEVLLDLHEGDRVYIDGTIQGGSFAYTRFTKSEMLFEWLSVGEPCEIPVITPKEACDAMLRRIGRGNINAYCEISMHDPRMANTYLMAAESIRDIKGAKYYGSFNAFCDWMSATFGYIYEIGEKKPSPYVAKRYAKWEYYTVETLLEGKYSGHPLPENIYYSERYGRFGYKANNRFYTMWTGSEDYWEDGSPRKDILFKFTKLADDGETEYEEMMTYSPIDGFVPYRFADEDVFKPYQVVTFRHRSEVFKDYGGKTINGVTEFKYSVDDSAIYSEVKVGYSDKNYDSINGRDEFNFMNVYTTKCTSGKTLTLESKYRADSYGIEFSAQKRGQDTTDSTSDKDVFFALLTPDYDYLVADRNIPMSGTLTEYVFNGAFSPMACAEANKGYIAMMSNPLALEFASSGGNSDVTIDGVRVSDNLTLEGNLLTCGQIECKTGDIEAPTDLNEPIFIIHRGVRYTCYLMEVDYAYAKAESANYKLVVKNIEAI